MNDKEGREKILKSTFEILEKLNDPSKVTIREISKKAGVSVGLINYHFKSKDYMLMEAVGCKLAEKALKWKDTAYNNKVDPKEGLKNMLFDLLEMGAEYLYLIEIAAKFELTEGDINTPLFILPYIMKITKKDELTSRVIAFSLISGLQSASLRRKQFKEYLKIDIEDKNDRIKYIDMMIDGLCKGAD